MKKNEAGFTLAELLVAAAVTAILLLGVLALFDFNNRVARVQTHVADMQQSLRVAQYDMVRLVRMTGRGGLPAAEATGATPRHLPTGVAVEMRDNVPANTRILAGDDDTLVVAGTDVLTVRGVFTSTIFQVNTVNAASFTLSPLPPAVPTQGTVVIDATSPTGVAQPLQALADAIAENQPEALLLVSPLDDGIFAVVELNTNTSTVAGGVATLNFNITGGTYTTDFLRLSRGGNFPTQLRSVAYVGLLEEYRFYVREEHVVDGDATTDLAPRLARARMIPGTAVAYHGEASNATVDIADNIRDLQVALGIDLNGDRVIADAGSATDEWLGNHANDMANPALWEGVAPNRPPNVYYIRVSTLAQTDRRDPEYAAPLLVALENRSYGAGAEINNRVSRMFRRRAVQTVIDLRNLA
jgi:Tfp pilus assembly protein PilW